MYIFIFVYFHWMYILFTVSNRIQIVSTEPRDGTIVKKGEDVRLSCKTNPQWFFCVWKGPGEIKQVLYIYKMDTPLRVLKSFSPTLNMLILTFSSFHSMTVCHSRKFTRDSLCRRSKNKTDGRSKLLRHRYHPCHSTRLWDLELSCE